MPEPNIIDELRAALKDEEDAVRLYNRLANEVDKRGLYRRAALLRSIAADEQRHQTIIEDTIEEVQTIGALIAATAPTGEVYWWVKMGTGEDVARFDDVGQAKKYVEGRTAKPISEAKWVNQYGFELGIYKGRNYIAFYEGDVKGNPTGRYLWGQGI